MRDLKIILTILDPVVKSNLRRSLPTVGLNIASCNLIGKLELSTPVPLLSVTARLYTHSFSRQDPTTAALSTACRPPARPTFHHHKYPLLSSLKGAKSYCVRARDKKRESERTSV